MCHLPQIAIYVRRGHLVHIYFLFSGLWIFFSIKIIVYKKTNELFVFIEKKDKCDLFISQMLLLAIIALSNNFFGCKKQNKNTM